jgi:hypothetical protein
VSDLRFSVVDIAAETYAIVPTLRVRLRIEERSGEVVHAMALRAQVRVEPQRRRYDDDEERGLLDLFGARNRWAETMKPFLWMHASTMVQGFTGETEVELALPCTYDFEVAGAKYLQGLLDGEVPLVFLFSGTVFSRADPGLSVTQVPWDKEARFRMPVRVWQEMMDRHFPGSQWLRLDRDTVSALAHYKGARGFTSLEEAVTALLAEARQVAR